MTVHFLPDTVVLAALMLLGVFSLRQLIEADIRSARARRRALKQLAASLGGRYERVQKNVPSGERVIFSRHGLSFRVYYEVVMAADDPSSYTRVQLLRPADDRCFPSFAVVPEDFLERADNLLFGRTERRLGDQALDRRVLIRAEEGPSLDAIRSPEVIEALGVFLETGPWQHDFLLESVPDLLRISCSGHLESAKDLEAFALAASDLLAALPLLDQAEPAPSADSP